MNHLRIAELLFNQPLMISETKLNVIQHFFSQRAGISLQGAPSIETVEVSDRERQRAGYSANNGIGVIGVYGPLLHRRLASEFPSGGPTTYGEIRRAFDMALADDAVQGIVLDLDSPGGQANGLFELADHIFESRSIKPITAVINEAAFSAAYLLASAAQKIVIPKTGSAGSIGVIATHADFSRMEDAAGITVTHIFAGARKADFSPHQPLSTEATEVLQGLVDEQYAMFVDAVARNRGMKRQAVINTQAGIFGAKRAVELKLADQVSAVNKAIDSASKGRGTRLISASASAGASDEETIMNLQELRDQHPELVAQIEEQARQGMIEQSAADTARAEAVAAESGRIMALVTAAVGEEPAMKIEAAANKGLSAEDLQALGVSLSAKGTTADKMLEAITSAAANGVQSVSGAAPEKKTGIDTAGIYATRRETTSKLTR